MTTTLPGFYVNQCHVKQSALARKAAEKLFTSPLMLVPCRESVPGSDAPFFFIATGEVLQREIYGDWGHGFGESFAEPVKCPRGPHLRTTGLDPHECTPNPQILCTQAEQQK